MLYHILFPLYNLMDINDAVTIIYFVVVPSILIFTINILQYQRCTNERKPPPAFILWTLLHILFMPFLIFILFILTFYCQIISVILRIRYGPDFQGLLEGADAIYNVEGVKNVINVLMVIRYSEERYSQTVYDTMKQKFYDFFFRDPERFPKFLYSFRKSLGYSFMMKNEVSIDDCVKKMKVLEVNQEIINKENAIKLITDCTNAPLPQNGSILWEAVIGTQPIDWNNKPDDGMKSYPIVFRVHHGVADGVSLLKLLVGAFADNPNVDFIVPEKWKKQFDIERSPSKSIEVDLTKESKCLKQHILNLYKFSRNILNKLIMSVVVLCLAPTTSYQLMFEKGNDRNMLQGPTLSGQLVLAVIAEESHEYVEKVKRIRNKVPGTAFSEIILTAFSASLNDYFRKNYCVQPESITAVIPVLSGSSQLKEMTPATCHFNVNLKNKFSLLYLTVPLAIANHVVSKEDTPVLNRLRKLQIETNSFKRSLDYMVNHWALTMGLGLFPHSVVKFFVYLFHCTTLASVLPGPPKVTLCGGSPLQDVAFWVPHMGHTGVSFSALTYDGRLQLGLNVDKALISDVKVAEDVLKKVLKYIDILDEETS